MVLRVERHPVRRQRRQVVDLPEPRVQLRAPQPRVRQLVLVHEQQHRRPLEPRPRQRQERRQIEHVRHQQEVEFATNLPHPLRQQLRPQTHPPPPLPPRQRQQLQVVPPMRHQPLRERTVAPPEERLHEQPTGHAERLQVPYDSGAPQEVGEGRSLCRLSVHGQAIERGGGVLPSLSNPPEGVSLHVGQRVPRLSKQTRRRTSIQANILAPEYVSSKPQMGGQLFEWTTPRPGASVEQACDFTRPSHGDVRCTHIFLCIFAKLVTG